MKAREMVITAIAVLFLILPFAAALPWGAEAREPEVITVYRGTVTQTVKYASWDAFGLDDRYCAVRWESATVAGSVTTTVYSLVPLVGDRMFTQTLTATLSVNGSASTWASVPGITLPIVAFETVAETGTLTTTITCWGK